MRAYIFISTWHRNKLSLDISSCDDDRFVPSHPTTLGLWLIIDHSIALQQAFPLLNTASCTKLNLKMQNFIKRWPRIYWPKLKGLGSFFFLSFSVSQRSKWSILAQDEDGTLLDKFPPSCFSAIPRMLPHHHSRRWFIIISFQPRGGGWSRICTGHFHWHPLRTESHDHS